MKSAGMEQESDVKSEPWMKTVLLSAAIYNALWGGATILAPNALFDWTGMARPLYPQIWQCVGMIVGVYGIAYACAAFDPFRHWPIVLTGLVGKILGPIGFALAVYDGTFPASWGWTILTNDLIWWIPFGLILYKGYRARTDEATDDIPSLSEALESATTQNGISLLELSGQSPILLVFLRHFGCTFCRETMADVSKNREMFAANGTRVILVHMSTDEEAASTFRQFGLEGLGRVSDPDRVLYRAIGLNRGRISQLFGLPVWWRGFRAGIVDGHGIGLPSGYPFQMPGVFLIQDGKIIQTFKHVHAGERPDYAALSVCEANNHRMREDLERAAEVQRQLLPSRLPAVEGANVAWRLEPTDELAGDGLNVVRLDDKHLALYVLDVSGHGVSSALLSVTLNHWLSPDKGRSGLFTKGQGDDYQIVSPVEVARKLNRQFPMDSETAQYFTLLYGILDTETFEFRYVTAGHPAPIVMTRAGAATQLSGTGVPIGLLPDAEYREHEIKLEEGDRLYLFSDGVLEAGNLEGEEFGLRRTLRTIENVNGGDLDASIDHLLGRVNSWRTGAPFHDDLSVLSLEVAARPETTSAKIDDVEWNASEASSMPMSAVIRN